MQYLNRKQTEKGLGGAINSPCPKKSKLGRNGISTLEGEQGDHRLQVRPGLLGDQLFFQMELHLPCRSQLYQVNPVLLWG